MMSAFLEVHDSKAYDNVDRTQASKTQSLAALLTEWLFHSESRFANVLPAFPMCLHFSLLQSLSAVNKLSRWTLNIRDPALWSMYSSISHFTTFLECLLCPSPSPSFCFIDVYVVQRFLRFVSRSWRHCAFPASKPTSTANRRSFICLPCMTMSPCFYSPIFSIIFSSTVMNRDGTS